MESAPQRQAQLRKGLVVATTVISRPKLTVVEGIEQIRWSGVASRSNWWTER